MRNTLLFLLTILTPVCTARAAVISGWIKNAHAGDAVGIEVQHYYLDGRSSIFQAALDAQSRFVIQAEILEPGIAFFIYNNDRLPIFLSDADTLSLKTDAFQFPMVVQYGAKNGADNQLLQEYLRQNQLDFNEFNNIRFKIGQTWVIVEEPMNGLMESLSPTLYKGAMDARKAGALSLLEEAAARDSSNRLHPEFEDWLRTEITYDWAYHLLVYGQVYAVRHDIQADFFDFLYDAPIICPTIGSEWYRRFVVAFMARQQTKAGPDQPFWSGQYYLAEKMLDGKSLAFFRSELISTSFSAEHFAEILPLYKHFLQKNPLKIFDDKVEGLYQKYARVSPGAPAPDFEARDSNGEMVRLDQYKGQIVYLNFWASWCGACLRKMEFFDEFEAELNLNGIQIVNISIDENPHSWEAALAAHPFKGKHLLASSGVNKNIAAIYGVETVPQYFIIGKTGRFETKATGSQPNEIRQQLLDVSHQRN